MRQMLQPKKSDHYFCYIQRDTDDLLVGNIGDSRAVLCRGGLAVDLSLDHKPEDEIELTRIKKAGGYLTGIFYRTCSNHKA